MNSSNDKRLFITCFTALVATAFGFIVRILIMDDWAKQFNLSETQRGEIFGAGMWPFAISIVLFSLIVDKIGYGRALAFAFACHAIFIAIVVAAPNLVEGGMSGYWVLYLGSFIGALGNGTVEAVINPVVATMFNREKTKWLNILHAGWPGGLVLGGVLALSMGSDFDWRMKVGLVGIPVLLYGVLLLGCTFPVNERVAAGVSFRDMLREVGLFGSFLVSALIVWELSNVLTKFGVVIGTEDVAASFTLPVLGAVDLTQSQLIKLGVAGAIAVVFGMYTLSLGRPMFVFLMIIMMPLAITELGTDTWITALMGPEMKKLGVNAGWVLVYTSFIMMVMRFFAGPIVHKLSPLGLLALSAGIAAIGLYSLSLATGIAILAAATLYGFGKTFFWPTMLGVVSEQFPKGGALTLNSISGLGMMAVGILGSPLLGNIQDKEIDKILKEQHPQVHAVVMDDPKTSVFGSYQPLDTKKVDAVSNDDKKTIDDVKDGAKKSALKTVVVFPVFMLACYLILLLYFKARGGYKPVDITHGGRDEYGDQR